MLVRLLASTALAATALIALPPAAEAQTRPAVAQLAAPAQRPLSFAATPGATSGTLVLPLSTAADLETRASALSDADRAAAARALEAAEFNYKAKQTLSLRGIGGWSRILIVGLGENATPRDYQETGAVAGRALISEDGAVTVAANGLAADAAAEFATGMGIGEYRSDLMQSSRCTASAMGPTLIVSDAHAEAGAIYTRRGRALIDAMAWTRDISNAPANVVYPESFVASARQQFAGVAGVNIQVLDVPAMQRLGMGAILGVGQGSPRPPRMMIITYRGQGATAGAPVVLAGKGITFDSGGLNIKTGNGMGNMRMDMSGAASVTGAVLALARSRAPVHVIAIAALAENMPDGAAMRPGDVLTAMNGKTIEIVSTDAEGRLVLADALAYADARLNPAVVVDVATLTGAVVGALADEYAGLFSRHDALASQLEAAGRATGEPLWRLPLHASYAREISSTYADIKNGGGSPGAGTGAHFIGEFISREVPWAHLDIAGTSWSGANDWKPDGSTGYAVRLLERFVLDYQPVPRGAGEGGN